MHLKFPTLLLLSTTLAAADDGSTTDACDNFTGACAVYDSGTTTTITRSGSPTTTILVPTSTDTLVTSTETIMQTTTVMSLAHGEGACESFSGACVVYGSDGAATATTTGEGNADGFIAKKHGKADGEIGAAMGLQRRLGFAAVAGGVVGAIACCL